MATKWSAIFLKQYKKLVPNIPLHLSAPLLRKQYIKSLYKISSMMKKEFAQNAI